MDGDDSASASGRKSTYDTNYLDTLDQYGESELGITRSEQALLDHVADSLARLGRVKRVGLGVHEKKDFVRMWTRTRRTW